MKKLLSPDKLIWLLMLLLLAERLYLFTLPTDFLSYSDDIRYIQGGIYFAETGIIAYGSPYPTAMIMPGMPVSIGLFSLVLGKGLALQIGLRLCGCLMGVATAWFVYKATAIYTKWGGLIAAAAFLLPNWAWMNHNILTETPYIFFFSGCLYYALQMGRSEDKKYFIGFVISFMLALMFRAAVMILLPISGVYLFLVRKAERKLLLKRALLLAGVLLLFVVPWSIRNYAQFGEVIPLTYGMGNPMLRGTYEGEGYPADEELDYETNVDAVMRELYAEYYLDTPSPREDVPAELREYVAQYDPNGEVKDLKMAQFLSLKADDLKANYRLKEWFRRDPVSLLKSYLYIKPRWMLNWVWNGWAGALTIDDSVLHRISQINFVFCCATVALALALKKHIRPLLFLSAVYWINVYLTATALVVGRYGMPLMLARYIMAGIGFALLAEAFYRLRGRKGNIV